MRTALSSVLLGFLLQGCSTVGYLWQAAMGQMELFNRARPIEEVVKDRRMSRELRALLTEVASIKKFGEGRGLTQTSNYEEYVDLKRDAVVWVVAASKPLKFQAKTWSWPIVGSFTYIGWFSETSADEHAGELKKEGWDVYVRGSSAYSSLGWFRDPILSTMIMGEDENIDDAALGRLVNVVLHESVHASLYIDGQSSFNESVASFAADRMTDEYLIEKFGQDAPEFTGYRGRRDRRGRAVAELSRTYQELNRLYESSASDGEKRRRKAEILARLKKKLKAKREINNAALIQYKTYGQGLEDFEFLFQECGEDWARFWSALNTLEEESFGKPQSQDYGKEVLRPLARSQCRKS